MFKYFFIPLIFTSFFTTAQNALNFDNVSSWDQVQMPNGGPTGNSDRTIEFWLRTNSLNFPGQIFRYGSTGAGKYFKVIVTSSRQIRIDIGGNNFDSPSNSIDTSWNHVAVVYENNAAKKFKVYINGLLVKSTNLNTTVNTSPNGAILLGSGFGGSIDELRIWNVARTQSEILAAYNVDFCHLPPSLVSYYRFNHGTANLANPNDTILIDTAGTNHGVLKYFSLNGSSGNWTTGVTLTPKSVQYGSRTVTTCNSYTSPSGKHIWSVSGNYIDTITYPAICDSIINISLTIVNKSTSNMNAVGCNKYYSPSGKYKWITSGTYLDTVLNFAGCDSIITINLTINKIDTNVHNTANVFTSWLNGGKYQWLDCDNNYAIIPGETNQSFTATANGSYAVVVSKNGCTDTSACHLLSNVGISESYSPFNVELFPNPVKGILHINTSLFENEAHLKIFDLTGRLVYESFHSFEKTISVPLNLKSGFYFIEIRTDIYEFRRRFIVE